MIITDYDSHHVDKQLYDQQLVGLPAYQTTRIQAGVNDAVRLIFGGSRRDHVTPILRDCLHWHRTLQHIEFKVALLVYEALNNLTLNYIISYYQPGCPHRACDSDQVRQTITCFCRTSFVEQFAN